MHIYVFESTQFFSEGLYFKLKKESKISHGRGNSLRNKVRGQVHKKLGVGLPLNKLKYNICMQLKENTKLIRKSINVQVGYIHKITTYYQMRNNYLRFSKNAFIKSEEIIGIS